MPRREEDSRERGRGSRERDYDYDIDRQGRRGEDGGGILKVAVHSATNIASADLGGTSDAFVTLELLSRWEAASKPTYSKELRRSRVVSRTRNPSWEESFEMAVPPGKDVLRLALWDEDRGRARELFSRKADPLGCVDFELSELQSGPITRPVMLGERSRGTLSFSATHQPASSMLPALADRLARQEQRLQRIEEDVKKLLGPRPQGRFQEAHDAATGLLQKSVGTLATSAVTSAILDKERLVEAVGWVSMLLAALALFVALALSSPSPPPAPSPPPSPSFSQVREEWLGKLTAWAAEQLLLSTLLVCLSLAL